MRIMLKSKIHNVKVTDVNLNYEGSITIDSRLMKKANIFEYEQVHVFNVTNGNRFITYATKGKDNEICVNGAAAKLVEFDNVLIIVAYGIYDSIASYKKPKIVIVNEKKR